MRGDRLTKAAWVLGLALVAGCVALATRDRPWSGFDHGAHLQRDLSCEDCHDSAESGTHAGMPDADTCGICHEDADPPELKAQVASYLARPEDGRYLRPATYADVRFAHDKHVSADLACERCHPGAKETPHPNPTGPMSMDTCMGCHEERSAANECATCHEEIREDVRPKSHGPAWIAQHGPRLRFVDQDLAKERCDTCHTRADCDTCHASQPPRDHGSAFRLRTHGLHAAMDRSRCLTCHQVESCERCHSVQPASSHRAGFGAPSNGHCISCHLPVSSEGCVTCHKSTPSHDLAPPKPPFSFHVTASSREECLSCHRRVSHPVGTTDCNACHR